MIKLKKITPMFTGVVTTANKYIETKTVGGIIDPTKSNSSLQEYQEVIAVGSAVRNVKVGDLVCINPSRYSKVVQSQDKNSIRQDIEGYVAKTIYNFNMIELDKKEYLLIQENDIDFIIDEYDNVSDIEVYTPTIVS